MVGVYGSTNPKAYDALKRLMDEFAREGVTSFLVTGSVIGALRHGGIIPWDKDMDIAVVNATASLVERVAVAAKMPSYKPTTDGVGPGSGGFGYMIGTGTKQYIDVWMFTESDGKLQCTGIDNGCRRWYKKYRNADPPIYNEDMFFPLKQVKFGPYMMPVPSQTERYLDFKYKHWRDWDSN